MSCLRACFCLLAQLLFTAHTATAADFFVSDAGQPSGDGSIASPWALQTAFNHPAAVQPGDTIWLRGGNYISTSKVSPAGTFSNTVFVCRLNGTSNAPIIVRQYPGERAVVNGGIYGGGSWNWLWGFEITNTDPLRDVPNQFARSWGVFLVGRGCRLINLTIHDVGHPGIGFWEGVGDGGEVYGCILWGNGFYDHSFTPTDTRGAGIYGQNQFGRRFIRDNIFFKHFTQGIHLYATDAYVNGFQVEGNLFFNNGAGTFNLFLGTVNQPMQQNAVIDNVTYFNPGVNGTGVRLGYEALNNGAITVRSNLIVNGTTGLYLGQTTAGTVTDNAIFGASDRVAQLQRTGNFPSFGFSWNSNRYITTVARPFIYADSVGLLNFGAWRTNTGYDANSSLTTGVPTGVKAVIRPNQYEPGRAHITVLNWTTQTVVNVDITAAGLSLGDAYEIRDVQNLLASPVLTGIHDGSLVPLPMNLTQTAPLVGSAPHISNAHSGTNFSAFLLTSLTPSNRVTVLSEGFEGTFPAHWLVDDANPDGTNASWAPVAATFGNGGAHGGRQKAYCAGVGFDGSPNAPAYRDSMTARLQQTINLSGLTNATLSFWFRIPSLQSCCDAGSVSIDGTPVWSRSTTNNAWQEAVIPLSAYVGGSRTLKFEFTSDTAGVAEGWYLDDILVTGYVRTNKFVVTTADDSGAGSLRQALLDVNAVGGGFITFNVAPGGAQIIQPLSPLPAITAPVNLDARTQPGYAGTPLIHLDGALVSGDGLTMEGGFSTVQGLTIHGFATGAGMVMRNAGNNALLRCHISANGANGLLVDQAGNNSIGGDTTATANVIAFNGGDGVRVLAGLNNRVTANAIFSNSSAGLSLSGTAVANDPGDTDTGPNQLQNYPVLTDATSLGALAGALNSSANGDYLLQFFANTACDDSGSGEGETWLGSLPVITDANGDAAFTFNFTPMPGKSFVTATATDTTGNTSAFSPCQRIRVIPVVSVIATDAVAAEPSNPGTFAVSHTGPTDADLVIAYGVGGTAGSGTDYSPVSGTVTIPAGTNSAAITIAPFDDDLVELTKTVIVTLATNAEYVLGSNRVATVMLLDNELGAVSVRNVAMNEGQTGTNNLIFTVSLSAPVSPTVTINYATSDGTARAGTDYIARAGTVSFPPGSTNQTIAVGVLGDAQLEDDEWFALSLSGAVNATLTVTRAVGTIYNDDTPGAPPSGAPGALLFDGVNDSVSAPDSPTLRVTNAITVEAWINRAVSGVQHCIVEKVGCAAGQGGYVLRVNANNRLLFGTRDDCNIGTSLIGATVLAANTWYHVAGVWDGAALRLYVNGAPDGTLPATRNPKPGNTPLKIGERGQGGTPFNGILDEVRVWSVARTVGQIQTGMNRVLSGEQPGLAGYWRLDDGAGLTATDLSGNGNHATLINGPGWIVSTSPLAQRVLVTTLPATDVTSTTATLNGSWEADGYPTTAFFQWGLTPSFGNSTPLQNFSAGANAIVLSMPVTGLLPGALYHCRLVVSNLSGALNFGATLTFATPGPPAVVTGPAGDISGSTATLQGTVNSGNLETMAYFEWGATKDYDQATSIQLINAGTSAVAMTNLLTGLSPGATYHYRLIGFNSEGIDVGSDATFTTALPPVALTQTASGVGSAGATLNALVNPMGAETVARFEWGATTNYGNNTSFQNVGADAEGVAVSQLLSGLAFGTAYHFRIVASNNTGVAFGEDVTFTTSLPPPPAPAFSASPTNGLFPLTVRFTNVTAGLVTGYAWNFGDGATAVAVNPTHIFTNAGSYTVSLTATGPSGSAAITRTNYILVTNPPPVAAFTASPVSGALPLLVNFTNLTTGVATGYAWEFGDNTFSSDVHPARTYAAAGSFTVRLTALGPGGSTTQEKIGFIVATNPPPVVAFVAGPTNGAAPLTVSFTNLTTGVATSYSWALGDGAGSSVIDPIRTFTNAGNYTVTLTATGPGGSSSITRTNYIVVTNPPPVAAFDANPTVGLAPLLVRFTNLTAGVTTGFAWDFGDGTVSTAVNPAKVFTNAGSYTVRLTATGPGGGSTNVRAGFVTATNAPPAAAFTGNPLSGAAPLVVAFTNTTTGIVTNYNWEFGDGTTSALVHPTKTYSNVGNYTVSLRANGPGGANTLIRSNYVSVNLAPAPRWALRLDGVNDFLNVPDSATLRLTNRITIEAWINRSVRGVQHSIMEKYGCNAGQGGYVLRVTSGDKLMFGTRDDCNVGTSLVGVTTLTSNIWYHVAGSWDGATMRVFVNGVLDGSLASTRNPKSGNTPLKIGERGNGGTTLGGSIDEVRLWSVARTAAELQANLAQCLSGTEPGLAGYWRLNEGSGLSALDSSANGNTATLLNGPLWVTTDAPVSCVQSAPALSGGGGGAAMAEEPPSLQIAASADHRSFLLTVTAVPGRGYSIEVSTDLKDWRPLTRFESGSGTFEYADEIMTETPARFYRVREQ